MEGGVVRMMVSVVIPMYNSEDTIKNAIDSVMNQSTQVSIEIHITNDGSTDGGDQVVRACINEYQHSPIPIYYYEQENKGVSVARNVGLQNAKGTYIAMLDADDVWSATKLARQLEVFKQHPEIDFLGCARNGEATRILGKKIDTLHRVTVKELFIKMYPQTSTAVFKRVLFEQLGGYDEELRYGEDSDFWVRYCAHSNFYYLPESLVYTGNGKPHFGYSGISANLKAMQIGCEKVLKDAKNQGLISSTFYHGVYWYSKLKYLRRILLTKARFYGL